MTENEISEIERIFGIKRLAQKRKAMYSVRDATVSDGSPLWWLGPNGPELVEDWDKDGRREDITRSPRMYRTSKPKFEIVYKD